MPLDMGYRFTVLPVPLQHLPSTSAAARALVPTEGHCLHRRYSNIQSQVWFSLCGVSGSWCTQGFVCALQESVSPFLCKFWQLYGGVNGYLLQEGSSHTQVYCTQSPCPCSSPLQIHNISGDTQTQLCLSLCGVSGSWCAQGKFELSENLWQIWGLNLNVISPFLPPCWGFCALEVKYLLTVTPAPHRCHSSL